jgi:hypothetical protein
MKDMKRFLEEETEEILKYKWIESEKLGYDIGKRRAAEEWILKYAKIFREEWNKKGAISDK